MKAVVWTDSFQMLVMFAGMLALLISGSMKLGGLDVAWDIANKNQRILFFESVHLAPSLFCKISVFLVFLTIATFRAYPADRVFPGSAREAREVAIGISNTNCTSRLKLKHLDFVVTYLSISRYVNVKYQSKCTILGKSYPFINRSLSVATCIMT